MQFLQQIKEISSTFERQPKICPKLTMFRSMSSKKLWVGAAKREAAAAGEEKKGNLTAEEEEGEGAASIASRTQGLTLGGLLRLIRKDGILAVLTNPLGNAVQQQSKKGVVWHTYAIYFQDGILGVYDPDFVPVTQRLDACCGVPLVKELVKALRGRGSKVTEVWFGGGGNSGERGQEMTREWIEHELVSRKGEDLGKWEEREGWVKLHF